MITLTDDQKKTALELCAKMTIGELVTRLWPDAKPDPRSPQGKALKEFLAGEDVKVKTVTAQPVTKGLIELTEEQKRVVDQLVTSERCKTSMEIARLVFPDRKVKSLSSEWRAVYAYMKEVYPDSFSTTEEPVDGQWSPPDKMQGLIALVNTYVMTGDSTRKAYNSATLKVSEDRQLKALMGYLREYTVKYIADTYELRVDRDLFLSTFIRWTHDKADLTEMERDQMAQAAAEKVNVAQLGREIEEIKAYHRSIMAGDEVDANGKAKRFGMAEVEQISQTRLRQDAAKARLKTLMEGLEEARSKRLGAMKDRNASILNLFEAWRGDPVWRESLHALAKREKADDAAEVKRLYDMDDVTALISGMTIEEASA
jgi:hypothetical protein